MIAHKITTCLTNSSRRARAAFGHSLVEAVCMLVVLVPILLLLVDGCVLILGLTLNANACRDAARAASMGVPNRIKTGEPLKNAEAAVRGKNLQEGLIRIEPKCDVAETLIEPLPSAPFGGDVRGVVTVKTKTMVILPFSGNFLRSRSVELVAQSTTNYTWSMPPSAAEK